MNSTDLNPALAEPGVNKGARGSSRCLRMRRAAMFRYTTTTPASDQSCTHQWRN